LRDEPGFKEIDMTKSKLSEGAGAGVIRQVIERLAHGANDFRQFLMRIFGGKQEQAADANDKILRDRQLREYVVKRLGIVRHDVDPFVSFGDLSKAHQAWVMASKPVSLARSAAFGRRFPKRNSSSAMREVTGDLVVSA
jgi:hypothetical protein